ncbi:MULTISPECIES: hypothetical protein [Xanthomonas]|uniref:hypothetical protein n=1 Tax=Xanthomonas TaxID=338 RepID=UPI00129021BB|nr:MULTISPECIES: hypothetical protein [Xanthomonas]MCS3809728.1 hypothetical protein [Xanthomonas sp. 4461]
MIEIIGPSSDMKLVHKQGETVVVNTPVPVLADAVTLGEALTAYTDSQGACIVPYDGSWEDVPFETGEEPKYFVYTSTQGGPTLVDIHIARAGDLLCPKQDVYFRLEDGDRILIGELVC